MDSNLMSCNRCGHTSSESAEVCAYCGADLSDSGDSGQNAPESTATELSTAAPVSSTTESAGLQETVEAIPPVPEPVEEIQLDASQTGIEIPETPEITAAEQTAAVEGETLQKESIIEVLQDVSDPVAEPMDLSAALSADSTQDQEKLVFDLPAETAVTDLIPEDILETGAAETAPEPEQAAFKAADEGPADPAKTVTAVEAPADVISLVRELAVSSQPEELFEQAVSEIGKQVQELAVSSQPEDPADESEAELEISIEPIQEEPKLEEQAEAVKSEQLEETIVLRPEAEITPVEPDPKPESVSDRKKALSKAQIIVLKKRKLAKIVALKKKKIALAKAKALEKRKAALAKAQALKKKKEEPTASAAAPKLGPGQGITGLLEKYKGQTIGINYDNLAEMAEAILIEVNDAYFSVVVKDNKFQYSFPIKTILSILEGEDGVEIGESEKKIKFKAVVKVFPVVLF
jgi:hypothetical protein